MTFPLTLAPLLAKDGANYALARVRDLAFDAVVHLWSRRRATGMTQIQLAEKIGSNAATVSRNLNAPGNWTLKTLAELVYALDGDIRIIVEASEDVQDTSNTDAYDGYGSAKPNRSTQSIKFSPTLGANSRDQPVGTKTPVVTVIS